MSLALPDTHQRFRRAVAEVEANMRAFGGPERAEIGWEEVRAVWAAGPRNGRPTPWDAWAEGNERVPLSRKDQPQRVPDFDVIDGIMEPYDLFEDLVNSCKCYEGEQPKELGDDCGDGRVDKVYGWEYYRGKCRFRYRCLNLDRCSCHDIDEFLETDAERSAMEGSAAGACQDGNRTPWGCDRDFHFVIDVDDLGDEHCVVEVNCFKKYPSEGEFCKLAGTGRFPRDLLPCTQNTHTELIGDEREPCQDLAVGSIRVPTVDEVMGTKGCSIQVNATLVQQTNDFYPSYHTWVSYTDNAGVYHELQGGPRHTDAWSGGCGPYGTLKVSNSTTRKPMQYTVVIDAGPFPCMYLPCLADEGARIDGEGWCYNPIGPNSNSATFSILHNCGLAPDYPAAVLRVPGWDELV